MLEKSKFVEFLRGFINFWNILRFCLIMICMVYFLINATSIIKSYLEYNTIVMVEYKQPNETDLPAVTICAYSFIYDDIDSNNTSDDQKNLNYAEKLQLRDNALNDSTVEYIFNNNITFDSVVEKCVFYPNAKSKLNETIPCIEVAKIVDSIIQGRKCFTIFSQLNVTQDNDLKRPGIKLEYEMNPMIMITLADRREINSDTFLLNETAIFTIHSPNIIPTGLDYKYYLIYSDYPYNYDVRFTKQISHLQPPPYKTNCKDYRASNDPGQRSRGDCLIQCVNSKTFGNNCFSHFAVITKDSLKGRTKAKYCNKKTSDYLKYANARRDCMDFCQLTCTEEIIEIEYADYYLNSDKLNVILIQSDATPYTIVHHEESITRPELIGSLGGHAHIWLGLSAIKIFNFFVHLVTRIKRVFFT